MTWTERVMLWSWGLACWAALFQSCDGAMRSPDRNECCLMSCPAPSRPVLLELRKQRDVCVCVPQEEAVLMQLQHEEGACP